MYRHDPLLFCLQSTSRCTSPTLFNVMYCARWTAHVITLLEHDGCDEADDVIVVRKDADNVGVPLDLAGERLD
ncbi:hypothetical protein NKH86_26700 [Mesorhizobium sp. M0913]